MDPVQPSPADQPELSFTADVLGEPYVAASIPLTARDGEDLVATLVYRPADPGAGPGPDQGGTGPIASPTGRAVLHVHGFADYFFQRSEADFWCSRGYDFYALDLRRYGRSLRAHQTANYTDSLEEYYEELDAALAAVRREHEHVVLSAHSTGGLTVPLWLDDRCHRVEGVFLNSPWLDMQGPALIRHVAMPIIHRLGAKSPRRQIPRTVDGVYARSLHQDHDGEFDFDLAWKPLESWPVYAGWVRAIREGHARIRRGLGLNAPVLVLCSTRTGHPKRIDDPEVRSTDIVLDVEQIRRRAPLLSSHVTVAMVEGAIHDVTLSPEPARGRVFAELDRWLSAYLSNR